MADIRLKKITVEPLESLTIQRGDVYITNTTESNSLLEGALVVNGGISVNCNFDSVSSTAGGCITVGGGISAMKSIFVGKDLTLDSSNGLFNVGGLTENRFFIDTVSNKNVYISPDGVNKRFELTDVSLSINITSPSENSSIGALVVVGGISIGSTQNATDSFNGGGLTVRGGIAVGENIEVFKGITLGQQFSDEIGLKVRYTGQDQFVLMSSNGSTYSSINMEEDDLFLYNNSDITMYTSSGSIYIINNNNTLVSFDQNYTDFRKDVKITSTTVSLNSSTGSLVLLGGLSIDSTENCSSITEGGSFTVAGGASIEKDFRIGESLGVSVGKNKNNKIVLAEINGTSNLTETESFTGFGSFDDSLLYRVGSTEGNHDFYSGSTKLFSIRGTNEVVFTGSSQSYSIVGGGLHNNSLSFISNNVSTESDINFFTKSGNNSNLLRIYKSGTFDSVTDSESLRVGWDDSLNSFVIGADFTGTGVFKDITFSSSVTDQLVIGSDDSIYMHSTKDSSNSTTGALILDGGMSINCIQNSSSVTNGGALTIGGGMSIMKSAIFGENLQFGDSLTINTTDVNTFVEFNIGSMLNKEPSVKISKDSINAETVYDSRILLFSLGSETSEINHEYLSISSTQIPHNIYKISSVADGNGSLRDLILVSDNSHDQFVIHTSGNIGIKTSSPNFALDINGTLNVSDKTYFNNLDKSENSSTASVVISGGLSVGSTEEAVSIEEGGSLTVAGGITVSKNAIIGGITHFLDETPSTSTVDGAVLVEGGLTVKCGENSSNVGNGGALTVVGGTSIGGDLWVGGSINGSGTSSTTFAFLTLTATDESINLSTGSLVTLGGITTQCDLNATNVSNGGSILTPGGASIGKDLYIGGNNTIFGVTKYRSSESEIINFYDNFNILRFSIDKNVSSHNLSFTRYDSLGNSVEKVIDILNSDGTTLFNNTVSSTSKDSGSIVLKGGLSISNTTNSVSVMNGGALTVGGGLAVAKDAFVGGNVTIKSTTESTDVSSGSLTIAGGVGVSGNLNVLGNTLIVGNLTVNGQTTTIETTNTTIKDNIFVLNSGPTGSSDSGFIIARYQQDNDTGLGDVVQDVGGLNVVLPDQNGMTNIQIKLGNTASIVDDYYKGWWIKVISGFSTNQIRKVLNYNGTTKIATVSSEWSNQNPSIGETVTLYNKPYVGCIYNETNDRFDFGATVQDPGQSSVQFTDYLPISVGTALIHSVQTSDNSTTGSLLLNGGLSIHNTADSISDTAGGTITTLGGASIAKTLRVGNSLYVNGSNITPNPYDMYAQQTFNASNDVSSFADITGLIFDNSVWGFDLYLVARIVATNNLYVNFHIRGINKGSEWEIVKSYVGDDTGIQFNIGSNSQIQYTCPNYSGFVSMTFKWRAWVN